VVVRARGRNQEVEVERLALLICRFGALGDPTPVGALPKINRPSAGVFSGEAGARPEPVGRLLREANDRFFQFGFEVSQRGQDARADPAGRELRLGNRTVG
jgi:hypothetical protein